MPSPGPLPSLLALRVVTPQPASPFPHPPSGIRTADQASVSQLSCRRGTKTHAEAQAKPNPKAMKPPTFSSLFDLVVNVNIVIINTVFLNF